MQTVQLTLNLPYKLTAELMAFLASREKPSDLPTRPKQSQQDELPSEPLSPPTEAPTATPADTKFKVSMPSFGRTPAQMTAHLQQEAERHSRKTEEELLKEQRAEERAARKAEADAADAIKQAASAKASAEVEAIKAPTPPAVDRPPKPWEL